MGAWKRLLCDFFRGNKLIPEYLGALNEGDEAADEPPLPPTNADNVELAALISLEHGSISEPVTFAVELLQQIGDEIIPFIEVGKDAVARYLRSRFNLTTTASVDFADDILNAPRILFGASKELRTSFNIEVATFTDALRRDVEAGVTGRAAVAFAWENDGIVITLSIAGEAKNVVATLQQLNTVVDPTYPASEWIEPLSDLIKTISRPNHSEVSWSGVDRGVLEIPRHGEIQVSMDLPTAIRERLSLAGAIETEKPAID